MNLTERISAIISSDFLQVLRYYCDCNMYWVTASCYTFLLFYTLLTAVMTRYSTDMRRSQVLINIENETTCVTRGS